MSWIVRLVVPVAEEEMVGSFLWDAGSSGIATLPAESQQVAVLAGFDDEDTATAIGNQSGYPFTVSLADTAWSQPSMGSVSFTTHQGKQSFTLDTGQVFGHGKHPTTRLLLDMMEEFFLSFPAGSFATSSFLDVGTGSGVLAIAAALAGVGSCVAIDIDPVAVATAVQNVAAVGVSVAVSDSPLSDLSTISGDTVSDHTVFDVVVCNVLLPVHRQLAPALADRVASQGSSKQGGLLLSGFLDEQREELLALYPSWVVCASGSKDGWASVFLRQEPIWR